MVCFENSVMLQNMLLQTATVCESHCALLASKSATDIVDSHVRFETSVVHKGS